METPINTSQEEMRAEMEAMVRATQENMETTRNFIWSRLEVTLKN
jgi:hypothetical protein